MSNSSTQYISKIDQNYPLSGRDNNSQGFRDNFKNIKQGLRYIDQDISILDENSLILSKEINDFQNNTIKRAQFREVSKKVYDETNVIQLNNFIIDYENGHYQKFTIDSGTHNISLINFPELEKSGNMIISINTNSTFDSYIDFENNILSYERIIFPLKLDGDNPHLFKLTNDNYEFYLEKLNKNNNLASTLKLKNFNNVNDIAETTSGSCIFLSGNINSFTYNSESSWFYITGSKLTVEPVSTTIFISVLSLTKDSTMSSSIPIVGSSGYLPITYSLDNELPTGLIFNTSTGQISGTPIIFQDITTYTVTVTDAIGDTDSKSFSLSVE